MTGAILVYCDGRKSLAVSDGRKSLAVPLGWYRFKCSRCGLIFKGVGE